MKLTTDQELADDLGLTVAEVRNNCRPSVRNWPCIKPKRNVWRFTEAQVEQIVAMSTTTARKPVAVGGQTARSRRRSA